MGKLQEWFDEYNSFAPHSALNIKTQKNRGYHDRNSIDKTLTILASDYS